VIDSLFLGSVSKAVADMRRHGMNDAVIACVIQDVRSATLNEEFRRLQELVRLNPPQHDSWSVLHTEIKEWLP
jgi:hypothetical protein